MRPITVSKGIPGVLRPCDLYCIPDTMPVNMLTLKFKFLLTSEEPKKVSARKRLSKSKEPIHGSPDSSFVLAATLNYKGVNGANRRFRGEQGPSQGQGLSY